MNNTLQEAVAAIKAGDKANGRRLLVKVLEEEPRNERAWRLMADLFDDPEKKRQSLQTVLDINPNNTEAREQLDSLSDEKQIEDSSFEQTSSLVQRIASLPSFAVAVLSGVLFSCVLLAIVGTVYLVLRNDEAGGNAVMQENGAVEVSGDAEELTETPTPTDSLPPTNTPSQSTPTLLDEQDACQAATLAYMNDIEPSFGEFVDTLEVAGSTSRIALSPIVQDLQSIRRRIENVNPPTCAIPARDMLVSGLNNAINSLLAFMNDEGEVTIRRIMQQSTLEMETGMDQLMALASGQPTPAAQPLPTDTPLPTPIPTPTALPVGSAIEVGDWQVQVQRVETYQELSQFDIVVRPNGRYALLFLTVTNRGLRSDSFIPFGDLEIIDADGRRSMVDDTATDLAESIYEDQIDPAPFISPDSSATILAVYDISLQSEYYVLVPGVLSDPHSASVYLPVP